MAAKIQYWLDANTRDNPTQASRLTAWKSAHDSDITTVHARYRAGLDPADTVVASDLTEEEFDELEVVLPPSDYDLEQMIDAAFDDLDQLAAFISHIAAVGVVGDDKYARLKELLTGKTPKDGAPLTKDVATKEFTKQKVLIFTEFADTARYLHEQLEGDGLTDVDRLDGSRKANRVQMIQRFAPFYNKVSADERKQQTPLRILISTDVLSEGVNLQDGTLIINYDLHWNPVRLMQRIGRVDRRMDRKIEADLVKTTPSTKASRGKIQIRNFLAPDALERLLRLNQRVQSKVLLISKTLGIPGGKLLSADDMLDDTKVLQAFKEEYEGSLSPSEQLRLKYQALVAADPGLPQQLADIPLGARSGKHGTPAGVFACRQHPRAIRHENPDGSATIRWTLEGGPVSWVMHDPAGAPVGGLNEINAAICSAPDTDRVEPTDRAAVTAQLRALETADAQQLRKQQQLPLDAPAPRTLVWMVVE